MTVSELIEELIKLPQDSNQDLEVLIQGGNNPWATPLKGIKKHIAFKNTIDSRRTVVILMRETEDDSK